MTAENLLSLKALYDGKENHAILTGNSLELLKQLPDGLIQTVITSPPYFGLRAYGTEQQLWGEDTLCTHDWKLTFPRRSRSEKDVKDPTTIQNANKGANCDLHPTRECIKCGMWEGELGQEATPEEFIQHLLMIFDEVWRVLRDDGTVWVNLADTYWKEDKVEHPSLKSKDMCLVPQLFACAMQQRGWYVRSEIIWAKKNCMPESMEDRCTRSHEQIWMFSKQPDYFYDKYGFTTPPKEAVLQELIGASEFGSNLRTVWLMNASGGYKDLEGQHHATFPEELPERAIRLSTSDKGACTVCGKPYERLIEKVYPQVVEVLPDTLVNEDTPDWYGSGGSSFRGHSGYVKADGTSMVPIVLHKGWHKSCSCEASKVRPCYVMDIFSGSGTTGAVALKFGRAYVGLELNQKYARMAEERLSGKNTAPLLAFFDD